MPSRADPIPAQVYVCYVTQDMQAVYGCLQEAFAKKATELDASLAKLARRVSDTSCDVDMTDEIQKELQELCRSSKGTYDKYRNEMKVQTARAAELNRNGALEIRKRVQTAYYSVIRLLVNKLQMYLAAPDLSPLEPMILVSTGSIAPNS